VIFIHPGSWIPVPTTTKEEGGKKNCYPTFFSHKVQRIDNYFIFEQEQKKFGSVDERIIVIFTHKIVTKLPEIMVGE
jgi:hypothetical protein